MSETTTTETVEGKAAETTAKAEEKVYSEEHVRKIHSENANRRKENEELRAQLDEANKSKDRLAEYERKELEQQKKFQELAEKERDEKTKLESDYKKRLTQADRRFILSEAKRVARELGIIDVDDVKSVDLSDLRLDDATDDVPGLKEKLDGLKSSKPHWFKREKTDEEKRAEEKTGRAATTAASTATGTQTKGEDAKNWDNDRLTREWNTIKL